MGMFTPRCSRGHRSIEESKEEADQTPGSEPASCFHGYLRDSSVLPEALGKTA